MVEYICGVHFCEICGDCMYCYGGDPCVLADDGEHYYKDEKDE